MAGCPYIRTFDVRTATPEQLANSTDTCESCDEPRHDGECVCPFHPSEGLWDCRACIAIAEAAHDEPRDGEPLFDLTGGN
jgi:hypothetical protein